MPVDIDFMRHPDIRRFRAQIRDYYRYHGRVLPWRETDNPYYILVSEIMLQQTQVARVLVKYETFLKRFPTVRILANASFRDVLAEWQGLGYNRRARALSDLAKKLVVRYGGKIPGTEEELRTLPGIGRATACAILAFAFNQPTVFIETNIRAVFIHFFFGKKKTVSDSEIVPWIEKTLDREHPRIWYYALMDYGVFLKKKRPDLLYKSRNYVKQPPFRGSQREMRGLILRYLSSNNPLSAREIAESIQKDEKKVARILEDLTNERLLSRSKDRYQLSE